MRKPFVLKTGTTAPSTSPVTLKIKPSGRSQLICIDRMSAMDETTKCTRVDFGFITGTSQYYLASRDPATAAYIITVAEKNYVPPDSILTATFYGVAAGDKLSFYAYGYLLDSAESD